MRLRRRISVNLNEKLAGG